MCISKPSGGGDDGECVRFIAVYVREREREYRLMRLKITAGDRGSAIMQEFLHDNDSEYKYLDTDAPQEAIKGDKHIHL